MKYLPKSILGAVIAALYLLLVFALILGAIFGGKKDELGYLILYGLLTLPWSILAFLMPHFGGARPGFGGQPSITIMMSDILRFSIPAVGAFINATIIYLVVGFVSRALQSFTKRS